MNYSLSFSLILNSFPPLFSKWIQETAIKDTLEYAKDLGLCASGDVAVVTSGQKIGFQEGTTTKMQVVKVQ